MTRFVLASALIFAASVSVFAQTQQPAAKKDQNHPSTTQAVKQEPAKPTPATAVSKPSTTEGKDHSVITSNQLPKAAQDYIAKTFPGQKIEKATKITEADGKVMFKVLVAGTSLRFDSNGNLLKEPDKNPKPAAEAKPQTNVKEPPAKPVAEPKKETTSPVKK